MSPVSRHVVVVGGGISGLAAALRLADSGVNVTLVEQSDRLGGKIRTGPAGVEAGAEQFLMRDPAGGPSAAVRLINALGLDNRLVHPVVGAAGLWIDGALRPLPTGTVVGVPGPSTVLDGVAHPAEHDVDRGAPVLAPGSDRAVGAVVRERLGDEVVEHLVDPLLGGVYAGRADQLSLAATMPGLYRKLGVEHTLRDAVAAAAADSRAHQGSPGPIFGTLAGGLDQLIQALADALAQRGVAVHLGNPVRAVRRTAEGWSVQVGAAAADAAGDAAPWGLEADGLVLACPARPAARLLQEMAPAVAELVGVLDYASVGLVTLTLPAVELPELSGFLVPADQGLTIKAATFFSTKWAHHRRADGTVVLRASIGRYGDSMVLQRPDPDLIDLVRRDLGTVLGAGLPAHIAAAVTRWGGGLPQYAPGHVDRVVQARELLADTSLAQSSVARPSVARRSVARPSVALAGAAFDGVGLPACIASAERAADLLLEG
jgi:oxygen-dependent protoporphyrinogen oxidase